MWMFSNKVRQTSARAKLARPLCGVAKSTPKPVAREFTLEEANEAVVELRPVVERMVAHGRKLAEAQREQRQLVTRIAGNGGDMQPSDLRELAETIQSAADAIAACAEEIDAAGAQIKSLEEGLLDFPSRREGELVLLCWKLGEGEIEYWHGIDEGFAGRKPL
jgi:hypothetical protein